MLHMFKSTIQTPIGFLEVTTSQQFLLSVSFVDSINPSTDHEPEIMQESLRQIDEYFKGMRKDFDLRLNPQGTEFQLKVWDEVKNTGYGKTASYLEIAIKTGSKNNTRAVGLANGKNPIPVVIPCHRIIGTKGNLTGYAGGLERKKWLLQHELKHSANPELLF